MCVCVCVCVMRQEGARLTFATSHFAELKAMAQTDERFATSAVEFDTVALKPTYKLLWGEVGTTPGLGFGLRGSPNATLTLT